jgi:hypothetical protein
MLPGLRDGGRMFAPHVSWVLLIAWPIIFLGWFCRAASRGTRPPEF